MWIDGFYCPTCKSENIGDVLLLLFWEYTFTQSLIVICDCLVGLDSELG